jgi:hypothetical protein
LTVLSLLVFLVPNLLLYSIPGAFKIVQLASIKIQPHKPVMLVTLNVPHAIYKLVLLVFQDTSLIQPTPNVFHHVLILHLQTLFHNYVSPVMIHAHNVLANLNNNVLHVKMEISFSEKLVLEHAQTHSMLTKLIIRVKYALLLVPLAPPPQHVPLVHPLYFSLTLNVFLPAPPHIMQTPLKENVSLVTLTVPPAPDPITGTVFLVLPPNSSLNPKKYASLNALPNTTSPKTMSVLLVQDHAKLVMDPQQPVLLADKDFSIPILVLLHAQQDFMLIL